MDGNLKLNFRHAPLKLSVKPVVFVPDIEQPVEVKEKVVEKTPRFKKWYLLLVLVVFLLLLPSRKTPRTLKKLRCTIAARQMTCRGSAKGTFIVEVMDRCSQSIYEVDGIPFHVAFRDSMYRVPARSLTVKNIDGDCLPKAYLDSEVLTMEVPFSWVTTSQHTWFSITVDGKKVVDRADVMLFQKKQKGNWIAYMFDLDTRGRSVQIHGDGTDPIYIYGV